MATELPTTYKDKLLQCLEQDENVSDGINFEELIWNQCEDAQRIDFVYENLLKYDIFDEVFKTDNKNDYTFLRLSQECYPLINSGNYHEALMKCTEAIMVAESETHLAKAYATRSEFLLKLKLYEECIVDVDRALALNPTLEMPCLGQRRQRAVAFLSTGTKREPFNDLPEVSMDERSSWKKWTNRFLEVRNGGNRNCVVATGDIQVGGVVALESPAAVGITKEGYFFYCHHCFKLCYNPIPCDKCTKSLYCSLDCKSDAFENYHREECAVLYSLQDLFTEEFGSLIPFRVLFSERPEDRVVALDIQAAPVTCPPDTFFNMTVIGAAVYGLLRQHTKVFRPPDREVTSQIFKNFIIRYLLYCRQHLLRINEIKLADDGTQDLMTDSFACGVYPLGSSFRHSCCPNVYAVYCGVTLVLVAIKTIKAGEECFISYGPMYPSLSLEERQEMVLDRIGFMCQCRACEENLAVLDTIPATPESTYVDFFQQYASEVKRDDVEAMQVAIEQLRKMIENPYHNYNLYLEIYKLACYYAARGNKRLFEYSFCVNKT